MSLEKIAEMDSKVLEALEGAQIVAGPQYDIESKTFNSSYSCVGCDCVCNQPCHGEGPCYGL